MADGLSPGQAGQYVVFSPGKTDSPPTGLSFIIENDTTEINGMFGLGPLGSADFKKGTDTGASWIDPCATYTHENTSMTIAQADLSQAVSDAESASTYDTGLAATQVFGDITAATTI